MTNEKLVFFDLETDSLELDCQIVQIAAIAVDQYTLAELETFNEYIAFDPAKASSEALKIIDWENKFHLWHDAMYLDRALSKFTKFLERHNTVKMTSKAKKKDYYVARLAGYNALAFDEPRLRRSYEKYGKFRLWHPRPLDTLQLLQWVSVSHPSVSVPPTMRLEDACKHYGIPLHNAHNALDDCRATIGLTAAMMDGYLTTWSRSEREGIGII